jgi:hypothetical protein
MLEKLFARLRSWRQGDLAAPPAAPLLSTAAAASIGLTSPVGLQTLAGPLTPPPLPADAWAESESGIVITDSGIIILEPEPKSDRASEKTSARASLEPPKARTAAHPPTLPAAPAPRTPGELEWDDVLARARARAELEQPSPRPTRGSGRAKAK